MVARKVELGDTASDTIVDLSGDVSLATWQAVGLAPLGPLDAQRVLGTDAADDRLEMVLSLLAEEDAVLAQRLAGG